MSNATATADATVTVDVDAETVGKLFEYWGRASVISASELSDRRDLDLGKIQHSRRLDGLARELNGRYRLTVDNAVLITDEDDIWWNVTAWATRQWVAASDYSASRKGGNLRKDSHSYICWHVYCRVQIPCHRPVN